MQFKVRIDVSDHEKPRKAVEIYISALVRGHAPIQSSPPLSPLVLGKTGVINGQTLKVTNIEMDLGCLSSMKNDFRCVHRVKEEQVVDEKVRLK